MADYPVPGVYREPVPLPPTVSSGTGVPVFLGYAERGPIGKPEPIGLLPQFEATFGSRLQAGYLAPAVRGFFDNGGHRCYVVALDPAVGAEQALTAGLAAGEAIDEADLVVVPDVVRGREGGPLPPDRAEVGRLQAAVLAHCARAGERFAILDALPGASIEDALAQRAGLSSADGALYHPWVVAADGMLPPSGHVAGVYAAGDRRVGVHKAPANEVLQGVLDLAADLGDAEQALLHRAGVNCLRSLPGRGIRVWGARTLGSDPMWCHVNVRRLVLTVGRWLQRNTGGVVFESNGPRLWARLRREVTAYLLGLFRSGALAGRTPGEAFYVKCDAETNPESVREAGLVVAEIGLAPTVPSEFLVVRSLHGADGVTVAPPLRP